MAVDCPICSKAVNPSQINSHIDSGCTSFVVEKEQEQEEPWPSQSQQPVNGGANTRKRNASDFFAARAAKRPQLKARVPPPESRSGERKVVESLAGSKRSFDEGPGCSSDREGEEGGRAKMGGGEARMDTGEVRMDTGEARMDIGEASDQGGKMDTDEASKMDTGEASKTETAVKRPKTRQQQTAPLAERMRPQTLDDICGQDVVGPHGVLRSLIESGRLPSLILWGASGTGKTTIARCMAAAVNGRFVELNATSAGVAECKRILATAASDLALLGRKTIIFCDEMHRFSKTQQDVFLRPVEEGSVTLVAATTENPSFRIASALLSRCRVFTLQPLDTHHVVAILRRALACESAATASPPSPLIDDALLDYLARFADGDARTALNLLELALSLTLRDAAASHDDIKAALTKTLVYDRAGDQHYDSISAFHKSVRGSDPDAALYYLARMLQSGEDALFIARRMVVIASEDIGLADSSLLPLATATYTATQQLGLPEARIPLAHCAVALCLAPKSTRVYRALNNALDALREPGVAALPVPLHLRNAPTRLMRDLGCGANYKYPPNYRDGRVHQTYLPPQLVGRRFLDDRDLGTQVDTDLVMQDAA